MKFNKYFTAGVLASLMCGGFSSCSEDFLDEENKSSYTTDALSTPQGIEMLTTSLYGHLRWWSSYEGRGEQQTMQGTDEFTIGTDACNEMWLTYDPRMAAAWTGVNGNTGNNATIWDEMYYGIASANRIIASADIVDDAAVRNRCLAHAYFLRGYNFYRLTAQYGHCVLQTEPTVGVVKNFPITTEQQCWEQTISDLRTAYNLFNGEDYYYGKGQTWTKATAGHFLAKALLFAASERCSAWNSGVKEQYLREALEACNYVIGARKLEKDYYDVFGNWTGPNCAIEQSEEVLLAVPHDDNFGITGMRNNNHGNRAVALFNPQFEQFQRETLGGTGAGNGNSWRGCITGGKGFQRFRPTEYTYSSYDNVNDSRLFKAYRTVYGTANEYAGNAHSGVVKVGTPGCVFIFNKKSDHTYDGFQFGAHRYTTDGQENANFTDVNKRLPKWGQGVQQRMGETEFAEEALPVLNSWILYQDGKYVADKWGDTKTNTFGTHGTNMYAGLNKHTCGALYKWGGDNSSRDIVMARVSDTYLTRAEIKIRLNDYPGAKDDIDEIRRRAAWHAGENRGFYVDGTFEAAKNSEYVNTGKNKDKNLAANEGWNLGINTYYLSNPDVAPTTAATENEMTSWTWSNLPAEDEAILAKIGVSGQFDRALHFILNERTRELIGEYSRWETLSRTKTLEARTRALNPDVLQFNPAKHYYRPVPQTFIDALTHDDGTELTPAEKAAWQNPGY